MMMGLQAAIATMDAPQRLQELAYRIPYHYLPVAEGGRFSQHEYWSWGYRYLGRLEVALSLLGQHPFASLLDIGCGDGRFLREVRRRFARPRLLGIDVSENAVRWARALNPGLEFQTLDLLERRLDEQFDAVTLLEVVEHVSPERLPDVLRAAAAHLRPGGRLVLTTPHTNMRLDPRHFQHFDRARLCALLEPDFDRISCTPFDYVDWPTRALLQMLGGSGRFFLVTHAGLNAWFFRRYMKRRLYGSGESGCQRLAVAARKRAAPPDAGGGPAAGTD